MNKQQIDDVQIATSQHTDGKWITDSEWTTGRERMMYGWRTDLLADSVPETNGRQMDR